MSYVGWLHPLFRNHLRLFHYGFGGQFLHIGRVAVFAEQPFNNHFQFGLHAFFNPPVDGGVLFYHLANPLTRICNQE